MPAEKASWPWSVSLKSSLHRLHEKETSTTTTGGGSTTDQTDAATGRSGRPRWNEQHQASYLQYFARAGNKLTRRWSHAERYVPTTVDARDAVVGKLSWAQGPANPMAEAMISQKSTMPYAQPRNRGQRQTGTDDPTACLASLVMGIAHMAPTKRKRPANAGLLKRQG